MDRIDWNLARAFSATADAGSLSAAARKLGLAPPTLSRQVAALEAALGVTLFERIGKRLVLTDAGLGLLPHARAMAAAAGSMALAAAGKAEDDTGRPQRRPSGSGHGPNRGWLGLRDLRRNQGSEP